MREPGYELFDHTADVGVCVRAATLAGLLEPATRGLYTVIGELIAGDRVETVHIELASDDAALLLRDYLAEVLSLFDTRRLMVTALDVEEFSETRLAVVAGTAAVDVARSALEREVKAVTYHELNVRPVAGGYEATYIVDI
ncbi:MAG: archease [Planctomycetota bacterium]